MQPHIPVAWSSEQLQIIFWAEPCTTKGVILSGTSAACKFYPSYSYNLVLCHPCFLGSLLVASIQVLLACIYPQLAHLSQAEL